MQLNGETGMGISTLPLVSPFKAPWGVLGVEGTGGAAPSPVVR